MKCRKRIIRMILKKRNDILTLTDLRTIVAMQQRNISISSVSGRYTFKNILESNLSWQKRISWINQVIEYKGSKGEAEKWLLLVHGDESVVKEKLKSKSDRVRGEKNPGFNHGGKLSPFSSKNTIGADPIKSKEIARISRNKNNSYDTRKEYWISRGFSEEEALQKIKERQTTFNLEKCIEKYGIEKGTEVWSKRQEKWLMTLDSKSQQEKDRISFLKSNTAMSRILSNDERSRSTPAIFYYLKFSNEKEVFYKIGITTVGLDKRFGRIKNFHIHPIKIIEDSLINCFRLEQYILSEYKTQRVKVTSKNFSSTECFLTPTIKESHLDVSCVPENFTIETYRNGKKYVI